MSDTGVIDFIYKEPNERALFHYDRGIARVYVDQENDTPGEHGLRPDSFGAPV